MITLHTLKAKRGAVKRKRNAVGRGNGSGHGTFSCRGCKGQNARSGGKRRPGFEGGQTPLVRRLPKLKGFKNPTKVLFQVVNVGHLNEYKDGEEVTIQNLLENGFISKEGVPVKILGEGILNKKLMIKVQKVSKSARVKIIAAGGKVF